MVPDSDIDLVQSELPNHIKLTRNEKGCLKFLVTGDQTNRNRYNVYEEFKNQESFALHQERAGKSAWGKVAVNVERHYQITEE